MNPRLRHHITGAIERGEATPIVEIPAHRVDNWNCDGSGPHAAGEVRTLPTGGDSNAILCRRCYEREMIWRRARNRELSADCRFSLPSWDSLKPYPQP